MPATGAHARGPAEDRDAGDRDSMKARDRYPAEGLPCGEARSPDLDPDLDLDLDLDVVRRRGRNGGPQA